MRKILSVAMVLICAAAVAAQETKPAKPTSPPTAKTKLAEKIGLGTSFEVAVAWLEANTEQQ